MKTWQVAVICLWAAISIVAVGTMVFLVSSAESHPTKEELLVSDVHANFPATTDTPNSRIINIAKDTCQSFDNGLSVQDAVRIIKNKYPVTIEQDYDMYSYTMVQGVTYLCPQYNDKVREFSK